MDIYISNPRVFTLSLLVAFAIHEVHKQVALQILTLGDFILSCCVGPELEWAVSSHASFGYYNCSYHFPVWKNLNQPDTKIVNTSSLEMQTPVS